MLRIILSLIMMAILLSTPATSFAQTDDALTFRAKGTVTGDHFNGGRLWTSIHGDKATTITQWSLGRSLIHSNVILSTECESSFSICLEATITDVTNSASVKAGDKFLIGIDPENNKQIIIGKAGFLENAQVILTLDKIYTQTTHNTIGKDSRPNILLIVADDFGYTDLSTYGGGDIAMPNIDNLAQQSIVFTNFHSLPTCSPTRSVMLSGVDNHINGVGTMAEVMAPNQKGKAGYEGYMTDRVVSVADLLKDSGYHTYMTGKWHLGDNDGSRPYDKGFEQVFSLLHGEGNNFNDESSVPGHLSEFYSNDTSVSLPENFYSSDYYADTMINYIKKNHGDGKPMFMYLAFQATHWPLQAPQEYVKKYDGKYGSGWDALREMRFNHMKELGIVSHDLPLPSRHPKVPAWDSLTPEQQMYEAKKMAIYAAMADNMDYNVGKVLDYLKQTGEYDNTIIIFTSDNGAESTDTEGVIQELLTPDQYVEWQEKHDNSIENLGNANSMIGYGPGWSDVSNTPFRDFKGFVSEGGIHVPFILKLPNHSTGSKTNAFASVLDLTPTFLDYTGIDHPQIYNGKQVAPLSGKSLRPLLDGKTESIYGENDPIGFELFGNKALFLGDWKILQLSDGYGDGKWRLYNLQQDPGELNDLSSDNPELLQKMTSLYEKYSTDVGVIPPEGLPKSSSAFISEEG